MVRTLYASLGLLFLAAAGSALGAPLDKVGPRVRAAFHALESGVPAATLRAEEECVTARGELDVFILGSIDPADLESCGVRTRTRIGSIRTAYLPPKALHAVASLPGVVRIAGAMQTTPALDLAVPAIGVAAQRLGGPGFAGANGAGVVIGAVDSGVDLDHEDFLDESGSTRLLSVWDQTDDSGPAPSGFSYGTDWTGAQIDLGIATEIDASGHGTAVLSAAAGDGSATGGGLVPFAFTGVAPKADLVMVKTRFSTTEVVDGVAHVFNVAAARGAPAVANLSLGYRLGPHDGTSLFETAIDALCGPGRLVFAAAHNWRGLPVHAEVLAGAAAANATLAVSGSSDNSSMRVDGYYDAAGTIDVSVTTPDGMLVGPVSLGGENAPYPGETTPAGSVYLWNGLANSTVDPEIYLEVQANGQDMDGTWTMTFSNVSLATDGEVDLWQTASRANVAFVQGLEADEEMVSEPGNAHQVIAVGAWSSKVRFLACHGDSIEDPRFPGPAGTLSSYSNPGPTRDGRVKPDVVAPGDWVACALTNDRSPVACPPPGTITGLLPDLVHQVTAGTSIATPLAAGVGALLLQARGNLDPGAVAALLRDNALVDAHTGAVPNEDWGFGKLYMGSIAVGVPAARPSALALSVSPNPAQGSMWIRFDAPGNGAIDLAVFDIRGRRVARLDGALGSRAGKLRWSPADEVATMPSGIYFVRLRAGGESVAERVVWLRR